MSQPLKFCYFGTPQVARDTLAALVENGFIPALVVTAPDAPRGRGLMLTPSPVKEFALEHNLPVITPEKLDAETIDAIHSVACDYALVVAYGKILPAALIESFSSAGGGSSSGGLGIVNVHYSLLPRHRGATPLEAALLAGDTETGVTIQQMVLELDAGDILAQETTLIGANETARDLRPRLTELGANLLVKTLPTFERREITPVPQDASQATFSRKLKKEDGLLDLNAPAKENWHKYRAYADTIGTYFFEGGKRMKITDAEFAGGEFRVLRVIPEGKREMPYAGR